MTRLTVRKLGTVFCDMRNEGPVRGVTHAVVQLGTVFCDMRNEGPVREVTHAVVELYEAPDGQEVLDADAVLHQQLDELHPVA